jgi:hypothetical protein
LTSLRKLHRTLAWLLTLVLLVGSGSPLGYRHAHADGDVEHVHNESIQQTQTGCHSHHHGHSHRHVKHDSSTLTNSTSHEHVSLFGFNLVLPVDDETDSGSSNSGRNDLLCVVRLVDAHVNKAEADFGPTVDFAWNRSSIVREGSWCDQQQKCAHQTYPFWLLCDIARHERSGVQLF